MNEQLSGTPDLNPNLEPYEYDDELRKPKQPVNKLSVLMIFIWVAVLVLGAFFLLNQDQKNSLSTTNSSSQTVVNNTLATPAPAIVTPAPSADNTQTAPVLIASGGSGGSSSNSGAGTSTSNTSLTTENAYNYYQTLANGQLATPTPTPAQGSTPTPAPGTTPTPTPNLGQPAVLGSFTGSSITTVDSANDVGRFPATVVGADGFARIAEMDLTNGALRFVQCTNAACTAKNISVVQSSGVSFDPIGIAMAVDGYARIVYSSISPQGLTYVQCSNPSCSSNVVTRVETADRGGFASMALGSDGFARIAYQGPSSGFPLKFARCTNITCSTSNIAIVDAGSVTGYYTNISLDSSDLARITYINETTGRASYAHCTNLDCTSRVLNVVDSSVTANSTVASTIGSDGLVRIAYNDSTNNDLRFALCNNTDCSAPSITSVDTTGSVGRYPSIKLGNDGFARVSYYDDTNGDLKYVQCTNSTCTTKVITTLDSTGDVGIFSGLAIGSDGYARVAYDDSANTDLKFWVESTYTGTVITPVATMTSNAGSDDNTAVTMGSDGLPRIAYFNITGSGAGNLHFIQCTNLTCTTKVDTTVDGDTRTGMYVNLSMGSDGFARLLYQDYDNSRIRFMRCTNASCSTKVTTDVSTGNTGIYNALDMSASDTFPRIAYRSATNLIFLKCGNADCTSGNSTVTVDSGNGYAYLRMKLGSDGFGRIVFQDSTGGLSYIVCTDATCSTHPAGLVDLTTTTNDVYISLALASDNTARVTYFEASVGTDLRFIQCTNSTCSTKNNTNVDSMGTVGAFSSVAIGTDGFARISYTDITNKWLKYVACTNAACTTNNMITADSTNSGADQLGWRTSIVVGSDGIPRISYLDLTTKEVKLWMDSTPVVTVNSFYYAVAPGSGTAGVASTVFTVGVKDAGGNIINAPSNTSVYLYSSGSGGTFSTTSGGSYTSALTITILAGNPSADYYYKNNSTAGSPYTLTASDNSSAPDGGTGLVDATTSYTLNAGTASQYTLTPSTQTVTANLPSSTITLTTKDSFGNVSNVTSNKTFTLSDGSSGQFSVLASPFTPVSTVTVGSGTSSNTFFYKASVPGTYTITATLAGFTATSGGNAVMTVNQATITQYYYNVAPASGTAGSPSTVFTVGAKDTNGNVVVLATNQNVYLYSSGAGGTFSTTSGGSYTSALTVVISSGGTTTDFYYKNNSTAGSPYTLTASDNSSAPDGATGIADATTSYALNAGTASVAVLTPSTQTVTAGVVSSMVTLTTKDSLGNPSNVASNTTFTLSSTGSGSQFSVLASPFTPITTVTVNSGSSSTTFFFKNNTAGSYTITAHAASGFSDGTSVITVNAAAIASYYYATAPATGAAGVSSTVFTVGAHDAFGNVVTVGSNQIVYLYSSAPGGTFSNSGSGGPFTATTVTITTGNTTADFYYKNNSTSGSPYTLTASDNSSAPDGAAGIVDAATSYSVTSGAATTSSLTPSSQSTTAGVVTSVITLTTKDSLGNPTAVGSNTTFTLSDADGGQFSVLSSPFTPVGSVTVTSGNSTATFFYRNNTAGSYTITASNGGFSPNSTTSVTVNSAAIASYYFVSAPTSANISVASGAFVVGAHDVFGNVVTVGSNTTVYLYSSAASGTFSNSGSGGPFTATSVVITAGNTTATFYYKDPIANPVTITASDQTPTPTPDTGIVNATTAFTVFNPDVVVGPNMPLPVRSATLDDSRPGDPNVHFSWNSTTASTIKAVRIQLCTDGLKNTACTTPTGADLSTSTLSATGGQLGVTGWAITTVVSAHEILITNATGAVTTIGGTSTLDLANFTNPTSIGTFFFRISTYTTTVAAPGDSVGYGAIADSTARSLTETVDVAESLIFRVANTITTCDGTSETNIADPNDAASDLVTLSPNPMTTSGASTGTAQFCASTNAEHGYSITYADWGSNSYDGHKGFWNGSHQFNPGGISAFTSTPGTEQFGFKVGVTGAGAGSVTAPYNAATYNYNDSGSAVQLASASASTVANIYTISYLANVSATTPGGTYRAHQMFVITATY
jgi:hypothetical protein